MMIGTAALLRELVIEGGDGDGRGDAAGPIRLLCIPEVRTACERLADEDDDVEVTVVPAGTTMADLTDPELSAADAGVDAWVTLDPLPEVVDARRGDDLLADDPVALASSDVVLVAWEDRADALETACGDPVSVRCVAAAAGRPWIELDGRGTWGTLRVGFVTPAAQAEGQAVLGLLATTYFAAADPPLGADEYASNDFDTSFRSFLSGVAGRTDAGSTTDTPLRQLVQQGPAAFGVVITLDATARQTIPGTRAEDQVSVLYPSPMTTVVVSLAPVRGAPGADAAASLAEPLRGALADTGWDPDDPRTVGLPRPGVADALDRLWSQVS